MKSKLKNTIGIQNLHVAGYSLKDSGGGKIQCDFAGDIVCRLMQWILSDSLERWQEIG